MHSDVPLRTAAFTLKDRQLFWAKARLYTDRLELMGWYLIIEVASTPREGSTFTARLPLPPADPGEVEPNLILSDLMMTE